MINLDTKLVRNVQIQENELISVLDSFASNIDENISDLLKDEIQDIKSKCDFVLEGVTELLKDNWVYIGNKGVYYINEIASIHPDLYDYECEIRNTNYPFDKANLNLKFNGFEGSLMSPKEIKKIYQKESGLPFEVNDALGLSVNDIYYSCIAYEDEEKYFYYKFKNETMYEFGRYGFGDAYVVPIYRLNEKDSEKLTAAKVIELWLKYDLIPVKLPDDVKETFVDFIKKLYDKNPEYLLFTEDYMEINLKMVLMDIYKGGLTLEANGTTLSREYILQNAKKPGEFKMENVSTEDVINKLLNCEKTRADIESYDAKILSDPNRGHWDLWEQEVNSESYCVELNKELVARNPISDIKDGGIIGIDFGTKSTIVAFQGESDYTLPMRIGMGQFVKKIEAKHYENPTVMEFINIDSFLKKYRSKEGRPETLWEDLTISHTAFNSLMESSSEDYYAFFSELKQWAGDKKRQIRLRDKKNRDILLPSYINLTEEDLDPIELYAYYIGLYINNMHNSNGIYLDYILSFPVTYEMNIRNKIIESFSRGIKKSLPITVLRDKEVMSKFRVVAGASEPAAYAICALEEYKFEPTGDEKVYYGIFDFGGGTTDFDFGMWREAGNKERRYDYVIEQFGAGGDQYLGGENLLELLAFEIFKDNQDKLRENAVTFVLPPECKRFAGSEILLSDSQEAKTNMKQLMEKLRPFWENHKGNEKEFETGIIKVNLFDKVGQPKLNFELSVDKVKLEDILYERIERGVINFFESLKVAFDFPKTKDIKEVKIFLAGNSSRSPIVLELFNKYIENETKKINEINGTKGDYFEILPPLGTEEAYDKMIEMGLEVDRDTITKPSGKTGVAFGLIKGRKGGKIKIIDRNIAGDEIKFKYFVGYNKKNKFTVITDREINYNEWYYFIDASEEDFEIYYTNHPIASGNSMDIKTVNRKKLRISKTNEDAGVFVRAKGPTLLEYVVAFEDGIENNEYLNEIETVDLN